MIFSKETRDLPTASLSLQLLNHFLAQKVFLMHQWHANKADPGASALNDSRIEKLVLRITMLSITTADSEY